MHYNTRFSQRCTITLLKHTSRNTMEKRHFQRTGVDANLNLVSFHLQFCEHHIAKTPKVETKFTQSSIIEKKQSALCFLWQTKSTIKQCRHQRLIIGARCLPSLANFVLEQTTLSSWAKKNVLKFAPSKTRPVSPKSLKIDDSLYLIENEKKRNIHSESQIFAF